MRGRGIGTARGRATIMRGMFRSISSILTFKFADFDLVLANGMCNDTFLSTCLSLIVAPILQHGVVAEFQRLQDEVSGDEKRALLSAAFETPLLHSFMYSFVE